MTCNVPVAEVINDEAVLPKPIHGPFGAAGGGKEGLLAPSVQAGLAWSRAA